MLNDLTMKSGARIILHDSNVNPLPDENGIDLEPNTAASIGVKMVEKKIQVILYLQDGLKYYFRRRLCARLILTSQTALATGMILDTTSRQRYFILKQ